MVIRLLDAIKGGESLDQLTARVSVNLPVVSLLRWKWRKACIYVSHTVRCASPQNYTDYMRNRLEGAYIIEIKDTHIGLNCIFYPKFSLINTGFKYQF
jgi:hypothetical protein